MNLLDECSSSIVSNDFDDDMTFDRCAQELELNGYSLLPLSVLRSHRHRAVLIEQAFTTARRALDAVSTNVNVSTAIIDPKSDSASWTGFHTAASIHGRYNQHREGFVFSNGEMFDVNTIPDDHPHSNFRNDMNRLFCTMHDDIATGVLHAIERRLKIPHLYFHHEFGPTSNSSQWHMKRYVVDVQQSNLTPGSSEFAVEGDQPNNNPPVQSQNKEEYIFLPAHTDPSLISVVILDRAGANNGGMGLEVFHPTRGTQPNGGCSSGEWREISQHGHDVTVIFVGSAFSYLTKGQLFPAAKHRVVSWGSCCNDYYGNQLKNCAQSRMAATLFVRPNGDAIMKPLTSPYLKRSDDALQKVYPSFRVWNARVAKNYMKKKTTRQQIN
ncbi:hypothetical protein ACHAXH_003659 [Discostella pseudostelligera]